MPTGEGRGSIEVAETDDLPPPIRAELVSLVGRVVESGFQFVILTFQLRDGPLQGRLALGVLEFYAHKVFL